MTVAVISGTTSGLGREFVDAVMGECPEIDEIWMIARRQDRLESIAAEYPRMRFVCLPFDLSQDDGYAGLEKELEARKPDIGVVVANAGVASAGLVEESETDALERMIRPNAIGLSCVRLEKVGLHTAFGPVLYVAGADLMDGSPIFDIKPYLAYCDSHPEALEGFTGAVNKPALHVEFPQELLERRPQGCREGLLEILAQDPRPGYQNEPNRVYGMTFAGFEIGFTVAGTILTVCRVEENGVQ